MWSGLQICDTCDVAARFIKDRHKNKKHTCKGFPFFYTLVIWGGPVLRRFATHVVSVGMDPFLPYGLQPGVDTLIQSCFP